MEPGALLGEEDYRRRLRQIAEVAGVAHTTIYRWIKDGEPR